MSKSNVEVQMLDDAQLSTNPPSQQYGRPMGDIWRKCSSLMQSRTSVKRL